MELKYQLFCLISFLLSFLLFYLYTIYAGKIGFIDKAKKFNNPITPTSAGIILYLNFLFFFLVFKNNLINIFPNNFIISFACLSILVLVSLIDDVKPIDPKIRLFFQIICVYGSLSSIPIYQMPLTLKASILFSLLVWVYIINITNFTDGSDGFLSINSIFVFLNIIFINYYLKLDLFSNYVALSLLPSLFVFTFLFNRPTAKLYLGDAGSVLIGFINGYLFLEILISNKLNLAISLLIYPILECSIALIKKSFQGYLPWIDTSNYSFLQPTIKNNKNKIFVFYVNIIFNIINSSLIVFQMIYGWHFIILNFLITLIMLKVYEKK